MKNKYFFFVLLQIALFTINLSLQRIFVKSYKGVRVTGIYEKYRKNER